ncbi:PAS domain-containing sensor histidine kinase [Actinomadura sp. NPDC047616]|uniref:sensor histidine kinase n=1 Tax=Actinomadura sp. NPDC047616 TaxID=3155914 RepID=UPI0033E407BA
MAEIDFAQVFEASPVAAAVLSPDLEYVVVNRAYERMLGRSRDQLIGRRILELFPGGPAGHGCAELRASLDRVVADGEVDVMALQRYDVEVPGRPGTFEERYWNAVNAPIQDPDGKVVGVIIRLEEVTAFVDQLRRASEPGTGSPAERRGLVEAEIFARARELQQINQRLRHARAKERQTADRLRQAVEQQRQAISDTSHDLRAPITGLLTRLEEAFSDPEADLRQILHAVRHDAERLGGIVSDLLELAQLDAGVPVSTQPVDLAGVVQAELALRRPAFAITTRLAPGVVVDGSPIRLARLLSNLMTNAERHARSRIEVSVTTEGDRAVLEVVDDGTGIPPGEREKVFDRFYRRRDARDRDPSGTGLGLPIARQIAQAHGGTLGMAEDPSCGTRMVLSLPLHASPEHIGG